jgi:hypothetical protein
MPIATAGGRIALLTLRKSSSLSTLKQARSFPTLKDGSVKILYSTKQFETALRAAVEGGFEVEAFDADNIAFLEIDARNSDVVVRLKPASRLTRFIAARDPVEEHFVPDDFGQHCGVDVY